MPKKAKNPIAAVIDIGSNDLKLRIAQTERDTPNRVHSALRGMKYLENLSYPLWLGRDTFQTGRLSFERMDKACEVLKNYLTVAASYGVKNIRTIASTAVREATNVDYVLDQIKIKTGLHVQVIDEMEEKLYLYKLLSLFLDDALKQSAMMVYIGAGSIGLSLMQAGRVLFTENIKVGSLRIGELFGELEEYTSDCYQLTEEYIASFTDRLTDEISEPIKHFIVSGHEIGMIAELTGMDGDAPLFRIPKEQFNALYMDIRAKSTEKTAIDYHLDDDKAEVLLPAACIYRNLMGFTEAEHITGSRLLPCDAILYEMLYPKTFAVLDKRFYKHTLLSAKALAHKHAARKSHYQSVSEFALTIFDKMKKIHGLGARDKLLLQTAAILHDIGKRVNNRHHYRYSYELVRGSDIVGLNHLETEIVALICLFHSRVTPSAKEPAYGRLDVGTRVRVSKLAAMLRLADALDRSHLQKFDKINVKITEEALIVTADTDAGTALEQWSFNNKSLYFGEVFGIKAIFRVRRKGILSS